MQSTYEGEQTMTDNHDSQTIMVNHQWFHCFPTTLLVKLETELEIAWINIKY